MKKTILLVAMLLVSTIPALAQIPDERDLMKTQDKMLQSSKAQYDNSGNCYYDPDDVAVLYEDGNIPISQTPCGGIVF